MNLDLQSITSSKLAEMHDSGQIQQRIESKFETLILSSIDEALNGYEIKRSIEKQISEQVSSVVADVGFSAYNRYIANVLKNITEGTLSQDVAEKIQKIFDGLMVKKYATIKASEIMQKYREFIVSSTDAVDQYSHQTFLCEYEERASATSFSECYEFKFGESDDFRLDPEIIFIVSKRKSEETGTIFHMEINGKNIDNSLKLGYLSEFKAFVINLYLNKTPIILDFDEMDNIDTSYNTDY